MGIDNAKFRRPVLPGDQLIFDLEMVRLKSRICKMNGKAYVRGSSVAEADARSRPSWTADGVPAGRRRMHGSTRRRGWTQGASWARTW